MFDQETASTYEGVYKELLAQLSSVALADRAHGLGGSQTEDGMELTMFQRRFLITSKGVEALDGGGVPVRKRIIMCKYILQGGSVPLTGQWVAYREFKDSSFFMSTFRSRVEDRLARHFSGRKDALETACKALNGQPAYGMGGDLCFRFEALPRVPLLLIFYEGEEGLPPGATVLFDRSASAFLDMECLAVLGWILTDELILMDKKS
jgi:hypothetical protein